MAPGEGALETVILRDRIYRAGGPELAATAPAPPFPFVAEEVAMSSAPQSENCLLLLVALLPLVPAMCIA